MQDTRCALNSTSRIATAHSTIPLLLRNRNDAIIARVENRAYSFLFLGVMIVICLGAYVAVSALTDTSEPLVRIAVATNSPTGTAERSTTIVAGTRTPTPTNTPFVLVIPTIIFPTVTATPSSTPTPTDTPTLPPFPSPRVLPTNTPTPAPPTNTPPPPPPPTDTPSRASEPTATNTSAPANVAFVVASGPAVDRSRDCKGQYYIFGYVRNAQGQGLSSVPIRYTARWPVVKDFQGQTRGGSDAGYYELTVGTSGNEFTLNLLDGSGNPMSASARIITSGYDGGNCWYQLSWRKTN